MGNATNQKALIRVGEVVFGTEWQKPMSEYLGVDRRTIGRWKDGDKPVRESFDGTPFPDVMRGLLNKHEVEHQKQLAATRIWLDKHYGKSGPS